MHLSKLGQSLISIQAFFQEKFTLLNLNWLKCHKCIGAVLVVDVCAVGVAVGVAVVALMMMLLSSLSCFASSLQLFTELFAWLEKNPSVNQAANIFFVK